MSQGSKLEGAHRFDVAIVGGGLAGLSLSILCAEAGYRTVLFEQKQYPFHRVCGEYIAMESWPFLKRLGLDLASQHLPRIQRLQVTTPTQSLSAPLEPGGFGVSRYALDAQLAARAQEVGVCLRTQTRVQSLSVGAAHEPVTLHTPQGEVRARVVGGAMGKFSNLDRQLRPGQLPQATQEPTYVGIKYHLRTAFPQDLIALHNFEGGYCGISAIEPDPTDPQTSRVCCCYLVSQSTLQAAGGIAALENNVLSQNPYLASIFAHADPCWPKPLSIAQVYFSSRQPGEGPLFFVGDAAGLIPPLCGNGMSMAFRSAHLLFPLWQHYLEGRRSLAQTQHQYQRQWQQNFGVRMATGRVLQHTFGHLWPVNTLLQGLRPFKGLTRQLIQRTHGQAFS